MDARSGLDCLANCLISVVPWIGFGVQFVERVLSVLNLGASIPERARN
jgi:hypothetical protein